MNHHPTQLVDSELRRIASLDVRHVEGHYEGLITFEAIPDELLTLFKTFEEMVNDQVFSRADEIEDEIESIGLRVVLDNGQPVFASDLHVYPSTRRVSFSVPQVASHS